ncbi:MAG: hypothetical protein ACRDH0_04940 [Actinomycetota bacterium]
MPKGRRLRRPAGGAIGASALATLCGELEALASTYRTEAATDKVAELRGESRRVVEELRAGVEA